MREMIPTVPALNVFGESNREAIAAQIIALHDKLHPDHITAIWGDTYPAQMARQAIEWANGSKQPAPSDDWFTLIKSTR